MKDIQHKVFSQVHHVPKPLPRMFTPKRQKPPRPGNRGMICSVAQDLPAECVPLRGKEPIVSVVHGFCEAGMSPIRKLLRFRRPVVRFALTLLGAYLFLFFGGNLFGL
jgi:hypothetical protein